MTHAALPAARCLLRQFALVLSVGGLSIALAGCETGSLLSGGGAPTNLAAQPEVSQTSMLSFAPVVGAPTVVAAKLMSGLTTTMEVRKVPVAKSAADVPDYTVRGFVTAAPDKTGTKLAYVWDVFNRTGQQVHRIQGEEIVAGQNRNNPWAAVDDGSLTRFSEKIGGQIANWVPKKEPGATVTSGALVASAGANAGKPVQPGRPAIPQNAVPQVASPQVAAPKIAAMSAPAGTRAAGTPTLAAQPASLTGQPAAANIATSTMAMVPAVTGAPGDGRTALSTALRRELTKSGVVLTEKANPTTYKVQGVVALGKPDAGKQDITIEWQVFDPAGKKVGTVSQKNKVPQGSLDRKWGGTADNAASAAAQGILKLLPKTAVN